MEARRSRLITVDTWSPSLHAVLSYETLVQSNTVQSSHLDQGYRFSSREKNTIRK